tara:strand:+ start:1018 stop:1395 length:378 start_codon:yes stop_codon:yes gene_type:complete
MQTHLGLGKLKNIPHRQTLNCIEIAVMRMFCIQLAEVLLPSFNFRFSRWTFLYLCQRLLNISILFSITHTIMTDVPKLFHAMLTGIYRRLYEQQDDMTVELFMDSIFKDQASVEGELTPSEDKRE